MIIIGLFVLGIGSTATMTWALAGIKLQDTYTKHEKIINVILTLLLLYTKRLRCRIKRRVLFLEDNL